MSPRTPHLDGSPRRSLTPLETGTEADEAPQSFRRSATAKAKRNIRSTLQNIHAMTDRIGGLGDETPDLGLVAPSFDHDSQDVEKPKAARKRNSILAQEVIEKFPEQDPQSVCSCQMLGHAALWASFVCIQANENFVKAASKVPSGNGHGRTFAYNPATVVVLVSIVSAFLGNVVAGLHLGREGIRNCWDLHMMLKMAPGSMLYTVGQILKFTALKYLPTDVMVLMDQGQLVVLAFFSKIFLKRQYSTVQWCTLTLVSILMMLYMRLRSKSMERSPSSDQFQNWNIGILIMSANIMISVLGSVLIEFLLKGGGDSRKRPYWEQKALMNVPDSIIAAVWSFGVQPLLFGSSHSGIGDFFTGWTWMTLLVAFMMIMKLWVSGLISKVLDSVVRQLGSCTGVLLIYVEELTLPQSESGTVFDPDVMLALLSVLLTMGTFAISAPQKK